MVWNVGRISNIVFCPKSPNFYQYLNYTELQDGKKGKKMFDFNISMLARSYRANIVKHDEDYKARYRGGEREIFWV